MSNLENAPYYVGLIVCEQYGWDSFFFSLHFSLPVAFEMVLWSLHKVSDATLGWLVLHVVTTLGALHV